MKKNNTQKIPKMILLVGIPGSGKSYFSENLLNIHEDIVLISQDTLGSRGKCEEELRKVIKDKTKKVIIDRCNHKKKDRQEWVDCAKLNKKDVVIIYFDYPLDTCVERVKNRVGHPTIKFGRGESIVKSFYDQLEAPSDADGYKKILHIHSFDECNSILTMLGCDPDKLKSNSEAQKIIKFPRTHHIFNLGGSGVTRDDLVLSDNEIKEYLNCDLTFEEKVDGANLGISIDKDYNIVFQNRSHYVSSQTSTQFKTLDIWKEDNSGDLYKILKPNRHILYGEWCYAKHSIHYTSLPNYFLAFDIFDKFENKFFSRAKFHETMAKTAISIVPDIANHVSFADKDELKKNLLEYLETKSQFNDGFVEGVYIRKDNGNYLERRCKLVRPDFIQGIKEHWSKMDVVKNVVL
jgi:atypical dual specificity phosphatase